MEIKGYEELIDIVSEQVAKQFLSQEKDISKRALLIDSDISEITRRIGKKPRKFARERLQVS